MSQVMTASTLALVATALAHEYGVRVTVSGDQAYTSYPKDGGPPRINIPAVNIDDADYITLLRGYIDHEAAHVRFTDRDAYQNNADPKLNRSAVMNMANIFEDVFVERYMSECFPGCKRNIVQLIDLMFGKKREAAVDAGEEIDKLQRQEIDEAGFAERIWESIFRYILYRVRSYDMQFLDQYLPVYAQPMDVLVPGLKEALDPIMQRVPAETESTVNNVQLANETVEVIIQFFQMNEQELQDQYDQMVGSGSSAGSGGGAIGKNVVDQLNQQGNSATSGTGAGTSVSDAVSGAISSSISDSGAATPCNTNTGSAGNGGEFYHVLKDLGTDDMQAALQAVAALDAKLRSLLQTYTINRGGVARTGRLDTNKLHRIAVGNSRIFTSRVEKRGINTEIMICVDMSGSMSGDKATLTSQALFAVMTSLRKIHGVKSGVTGFSGTDMMTLLAQDEPVTSRMYIRPSGGTLCGEALFFTLSQFSMSPGSRKLVVMLTDGDTSNESYFKEAIIGARKAGVEFLGVGIHDNSITHYLNPDECCVIDELSLLAPELFRMLQGKMVGI